MDNTVNVLYVDDEEFLHDPFREFLGLITDMKVSTASSAVEGIAMLSNEHFDAVVSDYQMPEMDGIEFLKRLRSAGNDIPFILFTGRGREEVVIEALNEGADHYIQKGGDPTSQFAQLVHMIRLAVEAREKERAVKTLSLRLESFIENTSDAIAIYDINGNIVSVNPAFERMYGWSLDQVMGGKPMHIPASELEKREKVREQVERSGEAVHYVTKRVRLDGRVLDINLTVSPIRDANGKLSGFASSAKDISEMVEVMEAITSIKEEFRVILGSIGDSVISTDTRGNVTYLNPAAEAMLGCSLDDAVGRQVNDIVHLVNESTRKPVQIPSDKVLRDGKMVGLANHSVVISSTGREYYVADIASPLKDDSGKLMGTVLVFRDVTKEKLSESRAASIHAVTSLLLHSEDYESAIHRALGSVCQDLRFDGGVVLAVDEGLRSLSSISISPADFSENSGIGAYLAEKSFSPGEDLPGEVWRGARTVMDNHIMATDQRELVRRIYNDGYRSILSFPLFDADALVRGVIILMNRHSREPENIQVSALMDIGSLMARFMARRGAGLTVRR